MYCQCAGVVRPTILNEQPGHDEIENWKVEVRVDGMKLADYIAAAVWGDPQFDLGRFAGKAVKISLLGRPNMAYTEICPTRQTM